MKLIPTLAVTVLVGALAWSASAAAPTQPIVVPVAHAVTQGTCSDPVPCPGPGFTGACGRLGVADFTTNSIIDLGVTGDYDPDLWVVKLDYESFRIRPGVTVTFKNHPKHAPVVLISRCPIEILGTLSLDGRRGNDAGLHRMFAEPGPGGFWGGMGSVPDSTAFSSAGHGPGGGRSPVVYPGCGNWWGGGHASFAAPGWVSCYFGPNGHTYGLQSLAALIGGSGGAGSNRPGQNNAGGGAGGGAILIGSETSILLGSGSITARGGIGGSNDVGGCGSGGMIRLVAPVISATNASVNASGGMWNGNYGGPGRIEIECNNSLSGITFTPTVPASVSPLGGVFLPASPSSVRVYGWRRVPTDSWQTITSDPTGFVEDPVAADVPLPSTGIHRLRIQGTRVPLGTPFEVRLTYTRGQGVYIPGAFDQGPSLPTDPPNSVWAEVDVDFQLGISTVQVRAVL